MLGYAMIMKDMIMMKRHVSFKHDYRMQRCSVISTRFLVQKNEHTRALTISYRMGLLHIAKELSDLW